MTSSTTTQAAPRLWRHPVIAAVICVAVLIIAALPAVSQWILAVDHRAAIALNAAIGVSPVIDHVILALADNAADERILFLVIVGFIYYCWRAKTRRRRAARLALFLFIVLGTAAALFAQEAVDEIIRRRSPAYKLIPFQNIGQIYDDSVKVREHESFPSEHGMFYLFIGFVLLRTGKRIGGACFVLAGLVLPLAKCTVGSEWLSDTYLGALPLAFLLSAIAVETRLYRAKTFAEKHLVLGLDKLSIITRGKRHLLDGSFVYGTRDIFRIEAAIKRYLRDNIGFFAAGERFSEMQIEMPLAGVRSIIRFVTMGQRKIVLRVYPLAQRVEAELHRDASEMLAGHHINAPRILNYTDDPRRYGVVLVAEEFICGESLRAHDLKPVHLRSLGQQLAKLHSVHSKKWGSLRSTRDGNHFHALVKRIDRFIAHAAKEDTSLPRADLSKWFRAWESEFEQVSEFSLTHNKLHQDNCIYSEEGDYYFLDFTTLEWAMPAKDVVKVHHLICENDAAKISVFESNYYEMLRAEDRANIRKFLPFYEALFHLTAAATQSKRIHRGMGEAEPNYAKKHEYAVSELKRLVHSSSPGAL